MSVQAPNAERQIWIFTHMLRIREFEERVKRTFTEHPGVIRGHTHLADGAEASIVGSLSHFRGGDAVLSPPIAATAIRWFSAAIRRR